MPNACSDQVLNSVKARAQGHDDSPMDRATGREVFDRVVDGFRLMSKWHAAIKEQSAFKRANPVDPKTIPVLAFFMNVLLYLLMSSISWSQGLGGVEGNGFNFECVDRYNYSKAELTVLSDVLSMLKGVAASHRLLL